MKAIETAGLTKRFDKITAVEDVNLEVDQGEIFGLLGPNKAEMFVNEIIKKTYKLYYKLYI
jgi:ABC-type uncharacterized transport system ATPase subunit